MPAAINKKPYLTPEQLPYEVVVSATRARAILKTFTKRTVMAIDFETTSLEPATGSVRLTTLYNDKIRYVFDHDHCGSFRSLAKLMAKKATYICYNIRFEGKWFEEYAPEQVTLWDLAFMRKSVQGGGGYKLSMIAKWDLGITMAKDLQNSGWSTPVLTQQQYNYAAFDGYVTWELFKYWSEKMTEGHWNGFHIVNDAWRVNRDMEATGLVLDVETHKKTVATWKLKRDTALRYFRRFTPEGIIANPNSDQQMGAFLRNELAAETIASWPVTAKSGQMQMKQDHLKTVARGLPYPMNRWMTAFIIVKYYNKYLSTYGDNLIEAQERDGKISSHFNMMQAVTGRYSSSDKNLQNIPRKIYIRAAFIRSRKGRVLVLADYSGIEVRVAAEISQDETLLHDTIYGNVHGTGAALINQIDETYFMEVLADKLHSKAAQFKAFRQIAKVFTFRLLYGAGYSALSDSLKTNITKARETVDRWANKYRKAYDYRFTMQTIMNKTGYLPVVDGRTIYVRKADRQLPMAANYPIQGAAASVMYAALYYTRKLMVDAGLDAVCAASVHDEILIDSSKKDAKKAHKCLKEGMRLGWLRVFPNTSTDNLIESAVGKSWAAKP